LRCCIRTKQCLGLKKCHHTRKCVVKKIQITKIFKKCHWKRVGRFSKKRFCCYHKRKCVNKTCHSSKRRCRWVGMIISRRLRKGCVWRRHGKHGKRRYCCSGKRICRNHKCRVHKKKCKYVGKIIKIIRKKSCQISQYGNKGSRRKLCCRWKNFCTGIKLFKCRPIHKKCHWRGKVHQRIPKYVCKWEKKIKTLKTKILL